MMINSNSAFVRDDKTDDLTDPVLSFLSVHHEGLWHAARLLGGYDAARLVDRCLETLAHDGCVSPRSRIMLNQIMDLLALERVDDPDQPYMGYFAVIDPLDPVVEEICLLTDGMRHTLGRAGLLSDLPVAA